MFCPEVHDSCLTKICPPHQVCRHEPYQTPSCVCPEGRAGQFCESEDRCTDASCLNGKTQWKYTFRVKFSISLSLYTKRIICMKFCLFNKIYMKHLSLIRLTCPSTFLYFLNIKCWLGENAHYHYYILLVNQWNKMSLFFNNRYQTNDILWKQFCQVDPDGWVYNSKEIEPFYENQNTPLHSFPDVCHRRCGLQHLRGKFSA